ncbi:MAG: hypothetical protein DRI28_06315, partial [Caldiserica bacterium]
MEIVERIKKIEEIIQEIEKREIFSIYGGNLPFFSYLFACIFKFLNSNTLVILPDEKTAEIFYSDILNFTDENVIFFPEYERVESEISEINFERVKAILQINENKKSTVVTYFPAVIKKVPPFEKFRKIEIRKGQKIRRDNFIDLLVKCGYDVEKEVVEIPGTFTTRGGIVDFFPPFSEFPLRVEFLGNYINSIRKFDVSSQSSFEKIEKVYVSPLSEFFAGEATEKFFSQVDGISFVVNVEKYLKKGNKISETINEIIENSIIVGENIDSFKKGKIFFFNVFPTVERFKIGDDFIWNC